MLDRQKVLWRWTAQGPQAAAWPWGALWAAGCEEAPDTSGDPGAPAGQRLPMAN
jgi:hypothetical protein